MGENQRLCRDAERAYRAALKKVDPYRLVTERVHLEGRKLTVMDQEMELAQTGRVIALAIGKAACGMAAGLESVAGGRIEKGVVLSNNFPLELPRKYETFMCTHPLPSEQNLAAAGRALELVYEMGEGDLVLCAISGGGSSIFSMPAGGISLEGKRRTIELLLLAGAGISQLNAVRKHLSAVKGGQLARAIAPAGALGLLLSDVPGDDLSVIASGPTVPDPSTFSQAWEVVERFGLTDKLPHSVVRRLRDGLEGKIPESPKPDDRVFLLTRNMLIGRNRDMLEALEVELAGLGYETRVQDEPFEGEARQLGEALARNAVRLRRSRGPDARPLALISGGESTVTVRGSGLGGRSTEMALAAAVELEGTSGVAVLAAGTDGVDGPTDAAGALAHGGTVAAGRAEDQDPLAALDNNDSYNYLEPLGGLIKTGPTGTNVTDVAVALVAPPASEKAARDGNRA